MLQRRMRGILDSWLKVQAAWLYLEPIFGSEDIRRQIPVEGKMFEEVDAHWLVFYRTKSIVVYISVLPFSVNYRDCRLYLLRICSKIFN